MTTLSKVASKKKAPARKPIRKKTVKKSIKKPVESVDQSAVDPVIIPTEITIENTPVENLEALKNTAQLEDDFSSKDIPPKVENSEPVQDQRPRIGVAEMFVTVVNLAFNVIAKRRGDYWLLSHDESSELGGALGAVVDEYFPSLDVGPVPVLAGVAAIIVVPRLLEDQKNNSKVVSEEGGKDGEGVSGGDQ